VGQTLDPPKAVPLKMQDLAASVLLQTLDHSESLACSKSHGPMTLAALLDEEATND